MNEIFYSVLLGIIQGLTEFLPVSSSGHLALIEAFYPGKSNFFMLNVLLHSGTLGAIIFYYRKEIFEIISSLFTEKENYLPAKKIEARKNTVLILICDTVTILIAFPLRNYAEKFTAHPASIGLFLLLTGILLLLTRYIFPYSKTPDAKGAMFIGFFQGLSVLPGLSRSGLTIFSALFFYKEKKEAVKFSFLAGLPVILGAFFFETIKEWDNIQKNLWVLISGIFSSFVFGLISIVLLEKITEKKNLFWFSFYLIPAGIIIIVIKMFF